MSTGAFKTFPARVQANIDGGRQAVLHQSPGRTPPHGAGEGKGVFPEEGGPERDGCQQRLRRQRGSSSPMPNPPRLKTKGFYSPRKKETPEVGDPAGRGGGTSVLPPPQKNPKGLRTASKEERARTQARTAVRLGALTVPQKAAPAEDIITREGQVVLESKRWDGGQGSESQTVPHDRRRRLARVEHRARS